MNTVGSKIRIPHVVFYFTAAEDGVVVSSKTRLMVDEPFWRQVCR
jgi:hypothetical protein